MRTRRMAGAVDDNFAFSGVSQYVPVLQVENPGSAPGIGHPSPLRHQPISSDDANYHGCLELGTVWNCLELFGTVWNCLVLPCDSNTFWFWSAANKTNQQDTVLTETYLAKFCSFLKLFLSLKSVLSSDFPVYMCSAEADLGLPYLSSATFDVGTAVPSFADTYGMLWWDMVAFGI